MSNTPVLAAVLSVLESDVVEDVIVDPDGITATAEVTPGVVLEQVDKEWDEVFSFVVCAVYADPISGKDKVEVCNVSDVAGMEGDVTLLGKDLGVIKTDDAEKSKCVGFTVCWALL